MPQCSFWIEHLGRRCKKQASKGEDVCSQHRGKARVKVSIEPKPKPKPQAEPKAKGKAKPIPPSSAPAPAPAPAKLPPAIKVKPEFWETKSTQLVGKNRKPQDRKSKAKSKSNEKEREREREPQASRALPVIRNCKEVGRGAFSVIQACQVNGERMAVKTVELNEESQLEDLLQEVAWNADHPNVAGVMGVVVTPGKAQFLYNLAESDLQNFLEKHAPLPPTLRAKLWDDVTCGVAALHEVRFTHNDLKPQNVLVFADPKPASQTTSTSREAKWKAAIADLGSISKINATWTPCGSVFTSGFVPPEYAQKELCTAERDLWALGLIGIAMFDSAATFWADVLRECFKPLLDDNGDLPRALERFLVVDFATIFISGRERKKFGDKDKDKDQDKDREDPLAYLNSAEREELADLQRTPSLKVLWQSYAKHRAKIKADFLKLHETYGSDLVFQRALRLLEMNPTERLLKLPATCPLVKYAWAHPKYAPLEQIYARSHPDYDRLVSYRFNGVASSQDPENPESLSRPVAMGPGRQRLIADVAANLWKQLGEKNQTFEYIVAIQHLLAIVMESYPSFEGLNIDLLPAIFAVVPRGLLGKEAARLERSHFTLFKR